MELIYIDVTKKYSFDAIVCAIGQFDGVHQGHLSLLNKTLMIGKRENLKTAVITFDPHPDYVLGKIEKLNLIMPFEKKKDIFESMGFDYLFVINFSLDVANMEPTQFVNDYLLKMNIVHTVVGYDFVFGKNGTGKAKDIMLYSNNMIRNTIIDKITVDDVKVSSFDVKKSLVNGDVEKARMLLGRPYEIEGEIIYGNQVGQKISVPTANIAYDDEYVNLKTGVYATTITIDQVEYYSITNIGHNPSFNYSEKRSLESHILNFSSNIYGKKALVKFYKRLRGEIKFASVDDFLKQINNDKEEALKILSRL